MQPMTPDFVILPSIFLLVLVVASLPLTLLPMARGMVYLVAVMDWYSRRVLSWRVSNTLDTSFCTEAVEEAIERYGAPEIFNTDQGCQFTSEDFTGVLKERMESKSAWMGKADGWPMYLLSGCTPASHST
jgi:hypothetical protein